jgi:hypothetical protein
VGHYGRLSPFASTAASQLRVAFLIEIFKMRNLMAAAALLAGFLLPAGVMAQAMIPPTGMDDASKPMPMVERMSRRFPQPVRVGDLVGLPVLNDSASTLGYVQQVVRTSAGKTELIVAYNKWFGWFGWLTRPVAVPLEAVGIAGRQLVSLDMPSSEYDTAPTWQSGSATALSADATIQIALAKV